MRNRQSTHIYTCSHPLSWIHLSQIILKPLRAAKKRQSKSVLVPKTERKFGCLLQNVLCNCDATHPTELSYHAAKYLSFLHLITFTSIIPWVVTTLKGARLRFLIHSPLKDLISIAINLAPNPSLNWPSSILLISLDTNHQCKQFTVL
jgi:hypothetical protein